jgi:tetratricopeptide (TPR) repeat protein
MTRHRSAISVGCFLLISVLLPVFAQTSTDKPQNQSLAATVVAEQPPKLTDEELARWYLFRKEYREAQDIFRRLTLEHPGNACRLSLHNQMLLSPALKCYQKSTQLDHHFADAQNDIGTIYYERKKFAKAIRSYKKAIDLQEDAAVFYLNLGYAYFGEKNYEESIAAFRKALQIDPETLERAKSRMGTVTQDRTINGDRARFYFLLAKSFGESGDRGRCLIYLKKARDEGYQDMTSVTSDPSFASVINDPAVQEFLLEKAPAAAQP